MLRIHQYFMHLCNFNEEIIFKKNLTLIQQYPNYIYESLTNKSLHLRDHICF